MEAPYDRSTEDLGNIVELGHVNVNVADQALATAYYVTALGLTRDPFLMTGTNNMWVNAGRSQFHLPTGAAQLMRGVTGLVVADRDALLERLAETRRELAGTQFAFHERADGTVETICPWGNRIDLHAPDPARFGPIRLGMAYVTFPVRAGSAPAIVRFYRDVVGANARIVDDAGGRRAEVAVGYQQTFRFHETDEPGRSYDGHHVQVYLANFSAPYAKLGDLGLISQESSRHQYRFVDIIDLDTREVLFALDHEVRSMSHPLYGRTLVNRDPNVNLRAYDPGRESLAWAMA